MIVKILKASGSDFHGVHYNDKKVEKGSGELMLMKNFPSFINEDSGPDEVRNYFKSIDGSTKNIHSIRISAVFHLLNESS